MVIEWSGTTAKLRTDSRVLHRIYMVREPIRQATVSGEGDAAKVYITTDRGTYVYLGSGRLERRP